MNNFSNCNLFKRTTILVLTKLFIIHIISIDSIVCNRCVAPEDHILYGNNATNHGTNYTMGAF